MISSLSALERLAAVVTVTPEYEGPDVPGFTKDMVAELVEEYPGIAAYTDYLTLLGATGGVYAHGRGLDLGLYGFSGYTVACFDEGRFLDRDRYFLFGEIMYPRTANPQEVFLAFDTTSDRDAVHFTKEVNGGPYTRCADSLGGLLLDLAEGRYPAFPEP